MNKWLREAIQKFDFDISVLLFSGHPVSKIYPFPHSAQHHQTGHTFREKLLSQHSNSQSSQGMFLKKGAKMRDRDHQEFPTGWQKDTQSSPEADVLLNMITVIFFSHILHAVPIKMSHLIFPHFDIPNAVILHLATNCIFFHNSTFMSPCWNQLSSLKDHLTPSTKTRASYPFSFSYNLWLFLIIAIQLLPGRN